MTWPEWVKLWGDVLGLKPGFRQVSGVEFFRNVPKPLKKNFGALTTTLKSLDVLAEILKC
jgi:hypothetical protein